jgi:hypothetical protein
VDIYPELDFRSTYWKNSLIILRDNNEK